MDFPVICLSATVQDVYQKLRSDDATNQNRRRPLSTASLNGMVPGVCRRYCSRPTIRRPRCRHLARWINFGFDPESGKIVITYQTFVVPLTAVTTLLVDTCSGERHELSCAAGISRGSRGSMVLPVSVPL